MEYKIGEEFVYEDSIVVAKKGSAEISCDDCFFKNLPFSFCSNIKCITSERSDNTDIIFKKVKKK